MQKGYSPLFIAVAEGCTQRCLQILFDAGAVALIREQESGAELTPLHLARDEDTVNALVKAGIPIDTLDRVIICIV